MAEYIEREKAFDAVFGQFCASSDETEAALNAAIEEIRAIPAADVRPVVHGKMMASFLSTFATIGATLKFLGFLMMTLLSCGSFIIVLILLAARRDDHGSLHQGYGDADKL